MSSNGKSSSGGHTVEPVLVPRPCEPRNSATRRRWVIQALRTVEGNSRTIVYLGRYELRPWSAPISDPMTPDGHTTSFRTAEQRAYRELHIGTTGEPGERLCLSADFDRDWLRRLVESDFQCRMSLHGVIESLRWQASPLPQERDRLHNASPPSFSAVSWRS